MCQRKYCRNCPHWERHKWYGGGYCWLDVLAPTPKSKFGVFWEHFENIIVLIGIIALFLFFPAIVIFFG